MKELIKEEISQLIEVLYDDEMNFNNADKTSHQKALSRDEIRELIKEVIIE